jgi:hypothetical protein
VRRRLFSIGHTLSTLSFLSLFFLVFFFPQALSALHLTQELARIIMLQIISFIFLLAYLQFYFSPGWRFFSLILCFGFLAQSVWLSYVSIGVR